MMSGTINEIDSPKLRQVNTLELTDLVLAEVSKCVHITHILDTYTPIYKHIVLILS